MKAENNPTTTVEHYFKAHSKEKVDGKYIERTIKVVVKPPFGDYYIYFRAINDRKYNDAKYEGTLDENVNVSGGNYNWNDGWLQDKGSNAINVDHHNLYMYYQYGESGGTDSIPEENVWYFTGYYTNPGGNGPAGRNSRMTGAANNPGWYYYKIPKDAKGHNNHNKADREIKPGETLMISTVTTMMVQSTTAVLTTWNQVFLFSTTKTMRDGYSMTRHQTLHTASSTKDRK